MKTFPLITDNNYVVTFNGLRLIKDISKGDYVLTHNGQYNPVVQHKSYCFKGKLLTILRARSNISLQVAPDQFILAVRAKMCPYEDRRCLPRECRYHRARRHLDCPRYRDHYKLEWINAGELKNGDFVYYPNTRVISPNSVSIPVSSHFNAKFVPAKLTVTPELMEWIGFFAAEGFVDENSVHFVNYESAERIAELGERLFGIKGTIKPRIYRVNHIRFNSRSLSRLLAQLVGKGAANKRLPEWVFGTNKACRSGLIKGLLLGDGSFRKDKIDDASHSYRYGSASPTLAHQLYRLLLAEGISSGFEITYPSPHNRQINGNLSKSITQAIALVYGMSLV